MIFSASAPGSFMIAGEHAVLHGYPALVSAISKRIYVSLQPRDDETIIIHSDQFSELRFDVKNLDEQTEYSYIIAAFRYCNVKQGCDITIKSEFSPVVGLGSSAAVLVATLRVINQWQNQSICCTSDDLLKQALAILHQLKGVGSGADLAASIHEGILYYNTKQHILDRLDITLPLHLVYTGYKTPTDQVIALVNQKWMNNMEGRRLIFEDIHKYTKNIYQAIKYRDIPRLGIEFNNHYEAQVKLGVSDNHIKQLRDTILNHTDIAGCKISGSGMGDCLLACGDLSSEIAGYVKHNDS